MKRPRLSKIAAVLLILAAVSSCATRPDFYSKDKFVGNIWPDATEIGVFGTELWSQITPANAGKWESVEWTCGNMTWGNLDTAYARAKDRGLPFRLHTLVWGNQQPRWLSELSKEDQRKEIEEWMSLLSQRYPEVDFIDVVNEPLHELPVYYEALGGKGKSGYEWVLESFRLARKYFPNAKLHLNDYNILKKINTAKQYADIIRLLQSENLIDGVGLQTHFLEETKALTAKACLDIVAETGLPLYITEFDVNIENDVLQARKFAELFTLFYEYPRIEGITLWGAVEGRMWRRNGYLIKRNGEYRISMEWLQDYLLGDRSYVLPEYVKPPRIGSGGVNRIEAESFDEGRGVEAEETVLAYIDGTDWVKYERIEMDPEYRTFRLRYSKGRGSASRVQVFLDGNDSDEVLSFELENTGSWEDFRTLEFDWPATGGTRELTLKFAGAKNVANIDYLEFAK